MEERRYRSSVTKPFLPIYNLYFTTKIDINRKIEENKS